MGVLWLTQVLYIYTHIYIYTDIVIVIVILKFLYKKTKTSCGICKFFFFLIEKQGIY